MIMKFIQILCNYKCLMKILVLSKGYAYLAFQRHIRDIVHDMNHFLIPKPFWLSLVEREDRGQRGD